MFSRRLIAAVVLLASACTPGGSEPQDGAGLPTPTETPRSIRGTVDIGILGHPSTLDPYAPGATDLTRVLVRPVYPSLFRFEPDGAVYSDLAASIASDGDGAIVTLREASWSTGRAIDARDVVASVRRASRPSGFARLRAKAVGRLTVRFRGAKGDWEARLARSAFVLPRGRARAGVGGGPLVLHSRQEGRKIVYKENPLHPSDGFDRVRAFSYQDAGTMRSAVASGDIDVALVPSTVNLADRVGDDVLLQREVGWEAILLDLGDAGLSESARRALAAAIDRDALEEGFIRRDGRVTDTLTPQPGKDGARGDLEPPATGVAPPDFALAVPEGDELLALLQRAIQLQLAPETRVDLVTLDLDTHYRGSAEVTAARLERVMGAPGLRGSDGDDFSIIPLFHVATFLLSSGIEGTAVNPTSDGPLWNIERWRRAEPE